MLHKPATTTAPIHDLLAQRWSPRAFDPNKRLSQQQVQSVLEAARWAPSCFGDQPWRFIVWNRHEDDRAWVQAFDCLAEGNQAWVKNVPVLIAILAAPHFRHNGKSNRWAQYDTGAAAMSICLQAVALGLAAHQMGGFDADRLRSAFAIPEEITPMAMLALGYQAAPETLPDKPESTLRESETAARVRHPLAEFCFAGRWGTPFGKI